VQLNLNMSNCLSKHSSSPPSPQYFFSSGYDCNLVRYVSCEVFEGNYGLYITIRHFLFHHISPALKFMVNYNYTIKPVKLEYKAGFTLVEILIAIFIFALVISTIYASYTGTFRIVGQAESQSEIYHMARVTLERIIEDLESIYSSDNTNPQEAKENIYDYNLFIGENRDIEGRPADMLSFISTANVDLGGRGKHYGVTKLSYHAEKDTEDDTLMLYRSERPIFEREAGFTEENKGLIICEKLVSINFTYYSGKDEEIEEWDSTSGALKGKMPIRVSITLEFLNRANPEAPIKFFSSVSVPLGKG